MKDFIKVQQIEKDRIILPLVNKKSITAIVESKKQGCEIYFNTQKNKDTILIKEDIEEMRVMLEEFIPVMIDGKKGLVNLDNIMAIYDTAKGTLFQTNFHILSKLGIITGFYVSDPIDKIILKIKMTDKADEKEYTKWKQ